MISCSGMEFSELARHHCVGDSYISRLFRLTLLAPDITKAILEGRQPPELTGVRLMRDTRFPLGWEEQRRVLGFVSSGAEGNANQKSLLGLIITPLI